ncbi:glycine zipper 2TM domain-containing protein [Asticcacaulis sp. EMRT-3]|uniref:glycine zipper 2TM domain-containing protein n=1 Tax=Asticcacaulis sp. EMRT-3 TaxID=3040349 RepID=UPI0024AF4DF2|nr:glycine zipper 2TM domain-containing protein [Asticcacaulis sp. EMRT-3]MDI7774408.1 glycine zipper 2TM domain-containing protein [Asticcacaulis sp. EMRT-3]
MKRFTTFNTLRAALALGLGAALVMPSLASAQDRDLRNYDGYCYAKKADAQRNGTVIGAVLGGLIGSQVSKHERGLGAVGGAVLGGVIGNSAGKSSVKCYDGNYYAYQGHYYDPAPAPYGYTVVYWKSRPSSSHYSHVYYDRDRHAGPPPWNYNDAWKNNGRNDNNGHGHNGHDNNGHHNGWRDKNGHWHNNR